MKPVKSTTSAPSKSGRARQRPALAGASAAAPDAADLRFVLGPDGRFVYASTAFARMMGFAPDAPLPAAPAAQMLRFIPGGDAGEDALEDDRTFLNFGPAKGREVVPAPVPASLDPHSFQPGAYTFICGDAGTRVEFQCDWIAGPDGRRYLVASAPATPGVPQRQGDMQRLIAGIIGAAANSLPESGLGASVTLRPEEMRQFIEMSDDMMCSTHADGGIIRFNPVFTRVLGYDPQEMIGKVFVDFVDIADRAAVRAVFYGLSQYEGTPPAVQMECRMLTASGDVRHTSWSVRARAHVLYCLGQDITESKTREAALIHREQQLSEAQALAHMGHWRWEVGASEIEWSSELYNIFGVTREEFTPAMDTINTLIHRRDLGRLFQAFQRAIIQQNDYDMDFRAILPTGEVRTIRCEGRCELDADGEVIALYGIMQDITPQKEHEKALRDAKEAAEGAYASKSRFLANMSHELRTPLNAIIGFSDLIEKQILGPLGNERYLDYVGAIRESGHHLLDLITDILDMSKIEAGKYELTIESVNISQVLRTVTQMMEARAQEGRLALRCHLPDEDVIINADRRALKQIFLNLLSNAVKFTQGGGSVDVSLAVTPAAVVIDVRDTGIGIPAHKLADVMKPFEQVSNAFTREHEGSGLGLAITKDLAELHKGTLTIDSRLGAGTTATVTLPRG